MNPMLQEELDEIEQLEAEEIQGFRVHDLESLNWVFRKLAAIEAKKTEVNRLAAAELCRIEDYRKRELDKLQRDEEYFHGLVSGYALQRREADPKFKSEKTPYGSLTLKKQQPKWNYDDAKLVEWLKANERVDLIRVKEEPVKTDIKKQFTVTDSGAVVDPDGQKVEGIQVEHRGDELVIKPEV
ncbi:host-nuclease inhibitor Gam family protein [Paenibacillus sp. SN-8-1]|uniref:host-nuclease inhibitor Gam family protein n=1 Tax=Paenibacillus sp. SN-8-1 TaxID=3435409 RepID=UPI003D9A42E3